MNDIKKYTGDNLGGLNAWEFALVDDVQEIPEILNGKIFYEVVLKPGAKWFEGYGVEDTMSFEDAQQDSDNGAFQMKTFNCKVPKLEADLSDTLNSLKNKKIILKLFYNNGTKVLAGNIQEPLYITSNHQSKSVISERNEFDVVISGEGRDRSPVYAV